eukprot:gene16579-25250_t
MVIVLLDAMLVIDMRMGLTLAVVAATTGWILFRAAYQAEILRQEFDLSMVA